MRPGLMLFGKLWCISPTSLFGNETDANGRSSGGERRLPERNCERRRINCRPILSRLHHNVRLRGKVNTRQ